MKRIISAVAGSHPRHLRSVLAGLGLWAGLIAPALAVQPDEILPDPALEARARHIGKDLRCLVCQNQSIDDSDADLARDLRILVRERLKMGESDTQVRQYVVDRYGNYVLLKPPFNGETALLWGGPGLLLLAGLWVARTVFRRPAEDASSPAAATGTASSSPAAPLSPEEQARLEALLHGDDDPAAVPQPQPQPPPHQQKQQQKQHRRAASRTSKDQSPS